MDDLARQHRRHLGLHLLLALADFATNDPWVTHWSVYPAVDEQTDEIMPACEGMSAACTAHLIEQGFAAETVEATEVDGTFADQMIDYHRWTRVRLGDDTVNIDWTARQFENLDPPPEESELHCPTIWIGDGAAHPLVPFTKLHAI